MDELIKLCIKEAMEILKKDSPTYFEIRRAIVLLNSANNIQQENNNKD